MQYSIVQYSTVQHSMHYTSTVCTISPQYALYSTAQYALYQHSMHYTSTVCNIPAQYALYSTAQYALPAQYALYSTAQYALYQHSMHYTWMEKVSQLVLGQKLVSIQISRFKSSAVSLDHVLVGEVSVGVKEFIFI